MRWTPLLVLTLLALAGYVNSLRAPFLFDDRAAIEENESIRSLWPPGAAFSPPATATGAVGRPLVNFSLALNYALSGLDVRSYHALNLALHLAVALALYGVVRRVLASPALRGNFPDRLPAVLALVSAGVWIVHPLLTESVTGVIQRSELLGSLFFALTVLCFFRSTDSTRPRFWRTACVAMCWLGVLSKEFIVSVPLLVLLLDRACVAGSFGEAWRRGWRMYLGLAASWVLLAGLMSGAAQRSGTVGFGLGMSAWDYLLTQCRAIVLYLKLAFWPAPLVLDYGDAVVSGLAQVWPQAILLVALAGATAFALWRRPAVGAIGFSFFAILAPSSSVVPLTTQTIAEHRMYLPLFAVIVLVTLTAHACLRRPRWIAGFAGVVVVAFLVLTIRRNAQYASVVGIWSDTVAKCPDNARALTNLGNALSEAGRPVEAEEYLRQAVRLAPGFAGAHYNLGNVLLRTGSAAEAVPSFNAAVQLDPANAAARNNLAATLARLGRAAEAVPHYEAAIALRPRHASTHYNLGNAFLQLGRANEAIAAFRSALQLQPDLVDARYNLAGVLLDSGRVAEAVAELEALLRIVPHDADAQSALARARWEATRGGVR